MQQGGWVCKVGEKDTFIIKAKLLFKGMWERLVLK